MERQTLFWRDKKEVQDKIKPFYSLTMISTNALLLFILKHDKTLVFNRNICLNQEFMYSGVIGYIIVYGKIVLYEYTRLS